MSELHEALMGAFKKMCKQQINDGDDPKKPFLLMKDSDQSIIRYGNSLKELIKYAVENGLSPFDVTPLSTEEYEIRFGEQSESEAPKEKKQKKETTSLRRIGPFHIGKTVQLKDPKKARLSDEEILDFMHEVEADIIHMVAPDGKDRIVFIVKGTAYEAQTTSHRKAITMLMRHLSKKP